MDRAFLCQRLKEARNGMNIKQDKVAEVLGIPVSGVSAIENGTRKIDILEMKILCELYKKDLNWFIDKADEIFKPTNYNYENTTLKYALTLIEKADTKIQTAIAYAIIGFLKNGNLLN